MLFRPWKENQMIWSLVQSDIDEILKRVCLIYENRKCIDSISDGNSK